MLYTTYFKNINKLPDNTIILIIALYLPKGFKCNNINIFHALPLAPLESDFWQHKRDKDFESYIKKYLTKITTDETSIELINNIVQALTNGKNVAIVCYESDYLECHRYALATHIESYGIKWSEFIPISN